MDTENKMLNQDSSEKKLALDCVWSAVKAPGYDNGTVTKIKVTIEDGLTIKVEGKKLCRSYF